jgi:hypothetical protein
MTVAADPTPAASSSASIRRRELPELPRAPALESKEPVPADLAEIDELIERITSEDEATRDDGVRRIAELTPRLVPAIRRRLDALATKADTGAMKLLLGDIRQKLRGERDDDPNQQAAAERDRATDYLDFVLKRPRPRDGAWKNLVTALALRRMLEHLGTTPAARGIVEVYVRFGEFMRLDAQRALARLGDRAVPALLEARRHPAEKISRWATRQLDALGRLTPGQAAQIADPQILSDVFRAWGRTRDLDAARIVISFAGSERGQLREAARQAIAMFGEAGHWQLRDAYENVVGKRAPRDWTWERTARELFGELDRLRRLEVEDLFEAGQKAQASGDLDAMRKAFDEVLARAPFFERADEMVGGYWAYGKKNADEKPSDALFALRRAERLSRGASHHDRIESLLLTMEAERLGSTGVVDRNLFKRALELDPGNARAKEALDTLSRPIARGDKKVRYSIAGGIGIAGLLGVLFVLFRPRRKADAGAPAEPKPAATEPDAAEPAVPNAVEPAVPNAAEPKTET